MKGYAFKDYNGEHMARALGMALPISFKHSVEICKFIKNKKISDAKNALEKVLDNKAAVPFRTYNRDLGHKTKIGPGRYPQKATRHFISLLESTEANAQFKGLNTSNLTIVHISAHKAAKSWHYGRKSRRKMKSTNIEIVLEEKAKSADKFPDKKNTDKKNLNPKD